MATLLDHLKNLAAALLPVITGIYVYFTYRLLKSAETQARLGALPTIVCNAQLVDDGCALQISNASAVPAYDFEILLMAGYAKTLVDFATEHVKPTRRGDLPFLKEEGTPDDVSRLYTVRDGVSYAYFGAHEERHVQPVFPLPDYLYVLLQYRDIFRRNYVQTYWFYLDETLRTYVLDGLEPVPLVPSPRLISSSLKETIKEARKRARRIRQLERKKIRAERGLYKFQQRLGWLPIRALPRPDYKPKEFLQPGGREKLPHWLKHDEFLKFWPYSFPASWLVDDPGDDESE
jgi:hypothetical protein